jgi:hypothetical protein
MREMDWDDVDELPEDSECGYCGFVKCACDEMNDQHEIDHFETHGEWL